LLMRPWDAPPVRHGAVSADERGGKCVRSRSSPLWDATGPPGEPR
jgi:hypothetical protein